MDTGSPSNQTGHMAAVLVLGSLSSTGWTGFALLNPANVKVMGWQQHLQIFRQRWYHRRLLWQQGVMEIV